MEIKLGINLLSWIAAGCGVGHLIRVSPAHLLSVISFPRDFFPSFLSSLHGLIDSLGDTLHQPCPYCLEPWHIEPSPNIYALLVEPLRSRLALLWLLLVNTFVTLFFSPYFTCLFAEITMLAASHETPVPAPALAHVNVWYVFYNAINWYGLDKSCNKIVTKRVA